MKCTNCDGRGAVQIAPNVKGLKRCPVCDGSGEVSQILQTNEEWLKSLDTDGLVDYLYEVHKGGNSVERQRWIENHKERVKMQFRGWLKEKHNE